MRWFKVLGKAAIAIGLVFPAPAASAQATTWYDNSAVVFPGSNSGSVWASSPSDVWLAGGVFNLQHWNGSSWSMPTQPGTYNRYQVFGLSTGQVYTSGQNGYQSGAIHSCTAIVCSTIYTAETELIGLWARSSTDLFVAGDGIIRHFNGSTWVNLPTGLSSAFNVNRFESISGGETRTFFVGRNGMIYSYNGSTLTQLASGTLKGLSAVTALSDNFAVAVGGSGTILVWNGFAWSPMASGTTEDLMGVFALSPTSIYATGANGTVRYFNGTSWSPVDIGIGGMLGGPYALSETQIYIPRANGMYGEVITSDASLNGRLLIKTTVPEPSTAALLVFGAAFIGVAYRRKTNNSDALH